jgi:prepilin-type N-terminal cleavage/methylation domain-containing protein
MRTRGFTLVELLVVVAIIGIMLATAALSVGSGTTAVRMKNAVRSVWHLSGYARTMALLRQRAVVVTYSEVWEGETFVKSRIQVEAGAAAGSAAETAPAARSIFDPDAEPPELADQTAEEEEAAAETAVEPQDFPDVRIKVEWLAEDGEELDKKKSVSVFSNVDYLLGRQARKDGDEKKTSTKGDEDEEARSESRDPVSVVFETNGRCAPHRIRIWKDGRDEDDAIVLEVDRFGVIKDVDGDETD